MVKGKIEAETLREARDNIRKLGFLPTNVREDSGNTVEVKKEEKIVF